MSPFRIPTKVILEPGCAARLPEAVATVGGAGEGGVLLVADPGLGGTPWPEQLRQALGGAGMRSVTFDAVEPNPRASTVAEIAELARGERLAPVVGLGGGSVLDAAKAAAMLATNGGACADYEGRERYRERPLPFIALPSTCGTGSEVTWVSVVSVPEARTKISIKGESMFPDWALVDPDLLATLPPHLVAWTGLDALTHALEAVTGKLANPISDALAEKAVTLILGHLRKAVADPAGDASARQAMARASTLAGMAFGNADVGGVHCLSETLGGLYDVPHGLANALLLVPVLRSHRESVEEPLARLASGLVEGAEALAPEGRAAALLEEVERLVTDLGLPPFASFEIPEADYPEIARRSVANGSNSSNPRAMGDAEYLAVLESL